MNYSFSVIKRDDHFRIAYSGDNYSGVLAQFFVTQREANAFVKFLERCDNIRICSEFDIVSNEIIGILI